MEDDDAEDRELQHALAMSLKGQFGRLQMHNSSLSPMAHHCCSFSFEN